MKFNRQLRRWIVIMVVGAIGIVAKLGSEMMEPTTTAYVHYESFGLF